MSFEIAERVAVDLGSLAPGLAYGWHSLNVE